MIYLSRADWGARKPTASYVNIAGRKCTVHYNGDPLGITFSTPLDSIKAKIRAIQNFHMSKGWIDGAYSHLTFKFTGGYGIADMRGFGHKTAAQGTNEGNKLSHALMFMLGGNEPVEDEWKRQVKEWFTSQGATLNWPHKKWHTTSCPGNTLTAWADAGFPVTGNPTPTPPTPTPTPQPPSNDVENRKTQYLLNGLIVTGVAVTGVWDDQSIRALAEAGGHYELTTGKTYPYKKWDNVGQPLRSWLAGRIVEGLPQNGNPILRKGDFNNWVIGWKKFLRCTYTSEGLQVINKSFDQATHEATVKWQKANGLVGDGIVGSVSTNQVGQHLSKLV